MIQSVFLCILKLLWCELEQNNVEQFMSLKDDSSCAYQENIATCKKEDN